MSILDKEKTRQVAMHTTTGLLTTHYVSASPTHASVSWPFFYKEDLSFKWTSGYLAYRDCLHVEKNYSDQTVELTVIENPSYHFGGLADWTFKTVPPPYVVDQVRDFYPILTDLPDFLAIGPRDPSADYAKRFKLLKFRSIDPEFSLVNFVLELGELRQSFKNMKKSISLLKHLTSREALKSGVGTLTTLGDLISSGILEYSYGAGAFIRDIVSIWKIASKIADDYQKFTSGMGVEQTTRNFVPENPPLPDDTSLTRSVEGGTMEFLCTYRWLEPPYTCVSASYRYWSSALSQMWGRTKFYSAKFGVEFDPSIIWNAIPLSFVLDWVYPVGQWLLRHRIPALDVNITVDGTGYGTGAVLQRQLQMRQLNTYSVPGPSNWSVLSSEEWQVHRRTAFEKSDVKVQELEFQGVTLRKVLNGTSLLWQKLVTKH